MDVCDLSGCGMNNLWKMLDAAWDDEIGTSISFEYVTPDSNNLKMLFRILTYINSTQLR